MTGDRREIPVPRVVDVDRDALARAWAFAAAAGPAGPAGLPERVVRTAYTHAGRFMERREPYWALLQQIPAPRLFRRPPARAHGYDEYGLDAGGAVLTRTMRLSDGSVSVAWVTPPSDESVIAYFDGGYGAPGERLAGVGVYRSEAGRLLSAEWRAEVGCFPPDEQFSQERYFYDEQGRVVKIEKTSSPSSSLITPEAWGHRGWGDFYFRYGEDGKLTSVGGNGGLGWVSLLGDFEPPAGEP